MMRFFEKNGQLFLIADASRGERADGYSETETVYYHAVWKFFKIPFLDIFWEERMVFDK